MKYPKPKLFTPSFDDKLRVANIIAQNMSNDKAVVVSDSLKIQGCQK